MIRVAARNVCSKVAMNIQLQRSGGHPVTEMGNQDSLSVDTDAGGVIIVHGDIDVAGGPILDAHPRTETMDRW